MADTKISALTAASAAAAANEFAINEAGTSKKLTAAQLRDLIGPKLIQSNSGAANAAAAPSSTWQVLTSNNADHSATTVTACMTTTGVPVGSYRFKYSILYRSAATTTGVKFVLDYTGTVTRILARHNFTQALSTAASLIPDSEVAGATVGLMSTMETRIDNTIIGPAASVDSAASDMLWTVEGLLTVSTSANLVLSYGNDAAAASTIMAGSCLGLERLS